MAVGTIGRWPCYFLGGNAVAQTGAEAAAPDRLLLALIIFMALDYLSGVLCAIAARRLSRDTPSLSSQTVPRWKQPRRKNRPEPS